MWVLVSLQALGDGWSLEGYTGPALKPLDWMKVRRRMSMDYLCAQRGRHDKKKGYSTRSSLGAFLIKTIWRKSKIKILVLYVGGRPYAINANSRFFSYRDSANLNAAKVTQ